MSKPRERDALGRFVKGHDIGRPKGSKSERARLLENFSQHLRGQITTEEWNEIVAGLIETAKQAGGTSQVSAAQLLFSYAFGKPPDTVYVEEEQRNHIAINIWQGLHMVAPPEDNG